MATDRPAECLTDGELVVRRLALTDAASLDAAIRASVDHLRPWMPWAAAEPLPLDRRIEYIERGAVGWDGGGEFSYGIFEGDEVNGGCGLHRRIGPGGIEIGYWVRADRIGEGVATRAARLLTDAAFALGDVDFVEIHHDIANVRSQRVPEKLGYEIHRQVDDEVTAPAEAGASLEWRLTRERWAAARHSATSMPS